MGLLNFLNKPRIPPFSVSVFGKLPCHREYFQVTLEAAFTPLKNALVAAVEELNRRGVSRPLVEPDRRFFVRMRGQKVDLAGCIWDSHDGQRAFPFMMAVPLPKRLRGADQAALWACLQALWTYLEAYFADLRVQPSDQEVYRRLRGVEHELPPVNLPRRGHKHTPRPAHLTVLALPPEAEEDDFLRTLVFEEAPSFIMLPTRQGSRSEHRQVLIGFAGLTDFSADSLRPLPPPRNNAPAAPAVVAAAEDEDTAPNLDFSYEDTLGDELTATVANPYEQPTLTDDDAMPVPEAPSNPAEPQEPNHA